MSVDTSVEMTRLVAAGFRALDGAARLELAASMFDTARALVLASQHGIPGPTECRRLLCQRLYPELADLVFPGL